MNLLDNPDPDGTLTGLWMPIMVSWYRKSMALFKEIGIEVDQFRMQAFVLAIKVRTFTEEKGGSGFTCSYGPRGEERLFIEYRHDLVSLERERTVAHEFGHVFCLAAGMGPKHHPGWKKIMETLGYPEEAEKTWGEPF